MGVGPDTGTGSAVIKREEDAVLYARGCRGATLVLDGGLEGHRIPGGIGRLQEMSVTTRSGYGGSRRGGEVEVGFDAAPLTTICSSLTVVVLIALGDRLTSSAVAFTVWVPRGLSRAHRLSRRLVTVTHIGQ